VDSQSNDTPKGADIHDRLGQSTRATSARPHLPSRSRPSGAGDLNHGEQAGIATRQTIRVTNASTARLQCSIATRTHPHTATADTSRSYVTHLIDAGHDARFVQEQVGHEHASTTSIYTCVSSDYRTRTLRRHLDATTAAALATQPGRQA
jgi:site-specific recombinase XerD